MVLHRSLAFLLLLAPISLYGWNTRSQNPNIEEPIVEDLPPIQFAGIAWSASEKSLRDTLISRGLDHTYTHEDGTHVYDGSVFGIQGSSVFAYFTTSGHLIRINILLDESNEPTNVRRFLEVRSDFINTYADYTRILSPLEKTTPNIDQIEELEFSALVQRDNLEVWSAWSHEDAEGNRSMVKMWLKRLSDTPPWPNRLVTRIWYYSPLWLKDHDEG